MQNLMIFLLLYQLQIMQSQPIPIKLVIVGDGAIGKTCILVSYAQNKFPKSYEPTIFDNLTTVLKIDNKIINLGLWDTAGQQQFGRLRPLAYPGTDVFLIAFSVIEPSSFVNARKKWYPQIHTAVPEAVKIFVGNKVDLRGQLSKSVSNKSDTVSISKETAKTVFQNELKCKYMECSALTRQGLKQVFEEAVRLGIRKKGGYEQKPLGNSDKGCKCQLI